MLLLWLLRAAMSRDLILNCECSIEQLGDGNCDKECVTPQCNYDSPLITGTLMEIYEASDCYDSCSNTCSTSSLNDGFCHALCSGERCGLDLGDCGYCAVGCFNSGLGNGSCSLFCNNYACGYDSGDCGSCAKSCFPEMLGNGTCDIECDTADCSYDQGDCNKCSEDCTFTMQNNGTCDPECFNEECDFDNNSCGCSLDCPPDEIGTCSDACMTYNCDFDRDCLCEDGCDANLKRLSAIAYQIKKKDLSRIYSFSDKCESGSCTVNDLLDGYNSICHEDKCQSSDCLYQLGACKEDLCPEDCLRCLDSKTCIECDPQSTKNKNQLGECVSKCSVHERVYELCLKNEGCSEGEFYKLCVPDIDDSSTDDPHVLVVDHSDPEYHESIQSALNYAWKKYTKILIKEGSYSIPFGVRYFSYYKEMNITFEGNPQATIKLLTTDFQFPNYFSHIHIKNIIFDGSQSIDNTCETDLCTYCPYISEINELYYDDRGNEIEDSMISTYGNCTGLSPTNLIDTYSSLFIENCEFKDIRYGSSNLIRVRNNDLDMLNTNFTNIFCNGTDDKGIIYIHSEYSNYFNMQGGTVRLVNNGYEHIDDIEQFGFLNAEELNSVAIKDVRFELNILLGQSEHLIDITDVFKTEISGSEFEDNMIMGSLIHIDNTSLKLKDITINSEGLCEECSEINVNIENNNFMNCQTTGSLIEIQQQSITNNVYISQNSFEQIFSNGYVIDVQRFSMFLDSDVSGGDIELETVDSGTITVKITAKHTSVSENIFEHCLCVYHMNFLKLPNTNLDRNDLLGLRATEYTDEILQTYIDSPDTYMQILPNFIMNEDHESILLNAKNIENFNFTNSEFSALQCYAAPCILKLSEMTGDVMIKGINGSYSNQQIIEMSAVEGIGTLYLEDIELTEIDLSTYLIHITGFSFVIAKNIHLKHLTATGLKIDSVKSLEVYDSSFYNISSEDGAFQIRTDSTEASSSLTLSNLHLSSCYSEYSAGIYLENQGDNPVSFDLKESNFTGNYAFEKGSNLHIQSDVILSESSKISFCNFINNTVELDGTVYIYVDSGALNITSCYFENNRAKNYGSDLYINSFYDFTLRMNDVEISNSEGTNNIFVKDQLQSITAYLKDLRLENISGGVFMDGVEVFQASSLKLLNVSSDSSPLKIEMNGESSQNILNVSDSSFISGSSKVGTGLSISSTENGYLLLTINNCVFESNQAEEYGSAIFVGSSVDLQTSSFIASSVFTENNAVIGGTVSMEHKRGGICFKDCIFQKNRSEKEGSAIYYRSFYGDEISIEDSNFTENEGLSAVYISAFTGSNIITTKNCTFERNKSSPLFMSQANWEDTNSEFTENESLSAGSGGFILDDSSTGTINSSKFFKNTGHNGGAGRIQSNSEVSITDSTFESNIAESSGGALYLERDSQIRIDNTSIVRNKAFSGSAIALSSCNRANTLLSNSWIYENIAEDSSTIQAEISTLRLENVQIHDNIAYEDSSGIYLAQSNIYIDRCSFYNQNSLLGSFIHSTGSSFTSIQSSSFKNGTGVESGGAIYSFLGKYEIYDSVFDSMESANGAAFYMYFGVDLLVKNSNFTNSKLGPVISMLDSNITIENSLIEQFDSSAIECTKGNLAATDLTIQYGEGTNGGGILCLDCLSFDVNSSTFRNLQATDGGAICIKSQEETNLFTINKSNFTSNQARNGGAVYIGNVIFSIEESNFEFNTAVTSDFNPDIKDISDGRGGAIFFNGVYDQAANISENIFRNNSASYNGGAIAWESSLEPNINSNTFENNSAEYGVDYSSFPTTLVEVSPDGEIISSRVLTDEPLTSIASGQKIPHFAMAVVDHYGQIVKTDNVNTVSVSGEDEVALSRTTKVVSKLGIANFTELVVSAPPGTTIAISVSADSIQSEYTPAVSFDIFSRYCEIGEVTLGNDCVICSSETYSLDPNESQCRPCSSNAKCYGRNEIVPLSGYWRSSNTSHVLWKCPNSLACKGGLIDENGDISYTGRCASGYFGNKCQSCDKNYSRTTPNQCSECPDWAVNVTLHVIVGVIAFIGICVLVKVTLDSAYKEKEEHSVYLKIFINYIQLVAMIANFNLQWPEKIISVFRIFVITSSAGTQFMSNQCFFEEDAYFMELFVIAMMPFIICIISVLIWIVISVVKGEWESMKHEMVSTIIIILFLLHPSLMTKMFSSMNCSQIEDGEFWLEDDMEILCWTSRHVFHILFVSLPTIILWGILVPAFCLLYLRKNKRKLDKIETKIRFGFLYNGYVKRAYFWEFVILYRKIIIICCSVFVKRISIAVQGLTVLVIFAASLIAHVKYLPFRNKDFNDMELKSITAATITIYCGLYYLTDDFGYPSRVVLFSVIFIVNAYFIYGWIVKTFGAYIKLLSQYIPFFKKFFRKRIQPTTEVLGLQEREKHVLGIPNEKYYSILALKHTELNINTLRNSEENMKSLFMKTLRQFNLALKNSEESPNIKSFVEARSIEHEDNILHSQRSIIHEPVHLDEQDLP